MGEAKRRLPALIAEVERLQKLNHQLVTVPRIGYQMVVEEVKRLGKENEELRSQLTARPYTPQVPPAPLAPLPEDSSPPRQSEPAESPSPSPGPPRPSDTPL